MAFTVEEANIQIDELAYRITDEKFVLGYPIINAVAETKSSEEEWIWFIEESELNGVFCPSD